MGRQSDPNVEMRVFSPQLHFLEYAAETAWLALPDTHADRTCVADTAPRLRLGQALTSTRSSFILCTFFDDPGSGLAEIFALTWVFIALVIGEVGLNILRWFTLGFDYAGNRFGPSTGCAGPSCKPRVFLKNELSARRCHDDSFPQAGVDYHAPVENSNFSTELDKC